MRRTLVEVVVPGECHQPADRLGWIDRVEVQRLFRFTDVLVGGLEHGAEQAVLVVVVVVQHPLVGARQRRDAVDTRAAQSAARELGLGRGQDARARVLRIARGSGRAAGRHAASLTKQLIGAAA
jgi:hypothetical protein